MNLLQRVIGVWRRTPEAVAATVCEAQSENNRVIRYTDLMDMAAGLAEKLRSLPCASDTQRLKFALVMGNGPCWMVSDIALLMAKAIEIPVPLGFSREQASNLIKTADAFLVDEEGAKTLERWGLTLTAEQVIPVSLSELLAARLNFLPEPEDEGEDWVCKIIHTSGTTSNPKGVRIRYQGLSSLLESLLASIDPADYQRYLSLVPLSLLIEQVTALYMPLSSGGQVMFMPPYFPLLGAPGVTAASFIAPIRQLAPSALTLSPALVEVICSEVKALERAGKPVHAQSVFGQSRVPFLACGGAPVDAEVLAYLYARNICVFEGYGLSENSSVVAWNRRGAFKLGTVGKVLPHVSAKLSGEGELLITGSSLFDGYENEDPSSCHVDEQGWLHTGDLAHMDSDGFITIIGRKKNIIITANGRNISPEWVESKLQALDFVEKAVLFGDGLEGIQGLIVINNLCAREQAVAKLTDFSRQNFSEVEQVEQFHIRHVDELDVGSCFTLTGRPRREKIAALLKSTRAGMLM